ncbi:MAG TPA: ATP-dependent metallopeptidase FtsH/Yme1/Tma family protein, partial [Candidatus Paceibacterota bacterium]|nr:ATP-dependent metallopeptidase FtsH/Yme1/Tma family protein [Candidatus Paceibacterota bacterium]
MAFMPTNFLNQNPNKGGGKGGKKGPRFQGSIAGAILIFLLISGLYLLISGIPKQAPDVPISDIAQSVQAGQVKNIVVEGDKLTITYTDGTVKTSKKEAESSLSQTLSNYGVTKEAMDATQIQIQNDSGFAFWLINILPYLLPIIFIVFFFWYLSRQVKGAGMQAFSFGQSKARITDPNDKNNRVTFKDVAGCKEAKEELKEIVDFLRNPKKFLD